MRRLNDRFQSPVDAEPRADRTVATFTNIIGYTGPLTPTNGLFTFFDDGSQTGGFGPQRFYRLILQPAVQLHQHRARLGHPRSDAELLCEQQPDRNQSGRNHKSPHGRGDLDAGCVTGRLDEPADHLGPGQRCAGEDYDQWFRRGGLSPADVGSVALATNGMAT